MTKQYSLQKRLIINTSVILVFFIALMSVVLINAYKSGIRQATQERLTAHFYGLLSVAEQLEPGQLFLPEEPLLDQRFNQYASGLSAFVFDETETLVWRSISSEFDQVQIPLTLPGEPKLYDDRISDTDYFKFHFVTEWESETGNVELYHFILLENKRPFNQVVKAYKNKLWTWLAIMGVSLIVILLLVLRRTLKPMRTISQELNRVKTGLAEKLSENHPRELLVLTDSINRFIVNERDQSQRYKDTLANLAHSLKTPLAVMNSAIQNNHSAEELVNIGKEQLLRMDQIVGYQLQRATSGPQFVMQAIELKPIIEKIAQGLRKVYLDKNIEIQLNIDDRMKLNLNEGDLYEVFGNLMDNACKFSQSTVSFEAKIVDKKSIVVIEDDGPGIPTQVRELVLTRGKRLDETKEGQGIGMSVVKEILEAYKGSIQIAKSSRLGGAKITLEFHTT